MHLKHKHWQAVVTCGLVSIAVIETMFPELQRSVLMLALAVNLVWVWT